MNFNVETAAAEDFDSLVELRIEAMKESLIAIGRFDRKRSIARFRSTFAPERTTKVMKDSILVGFIAVTESSDHLHLDHLYIHPRFQSLGIGSRLIKELIDRSEAKGLPIRLGALRSSQSNSFYQRHGFTATSEDEWDIYYERRCRKGSGD